MAYKRRVPCRITDQIDAGVTAAGCCGEAMRSATLLESTAFPRAGRKIIGGRAATVSEQRALHPN